MKRERERERKRGEWLIGRPLNSVITDFSAV